MIVCSRTVNWWDEDVKGAIRKAHARYTSSKATTGWKECAIAKRKVKEMVEKKVIRKDVVNGTNEDFEGGMKQMWVGTKRDNGQKSRRGRDGNHSYLKSIER